MGNNSRFRFYPFDLNLKFPQKFLSSLSSFSTSMKHIEFIDIELEKNFDNFIQSQIKLSSIKLNHVDISSPLLLNSLKYHSNTLTSISFDYCYFSDRNMRVDAISYLIHLESLQFNYSNYLCSTDELELKFIQPLLNITTPLKIKTLVITYIGEESEKKLLQSLIQKIGSYIEILGLSISNEDLRKGLFDTVIIIVIKLNFLIYVLVILICLKYLK